jgi:predicted GTPase
VFEQYPTLGCVLPAMGYGAAQMAALQATIDAVPCDLVLLGIPVDLRRSLDMRHPLARVRYELEEVLPGVLETMLSALRRKDETRTHVTWATPGTGLG